MKKNIKARKRRFFIITEVLFEKKYFDIFFCSRVNLIHKFKSQQNQSYFSSTMLRKSLKLLRGVRRAGLAQFIPTAVNVSSGSSNRWIATSRVIRANNRSVNSLNRLFSADAASSSVSESTAATGQKFEFQAETRKLLDIVTNSIYTDKEVFLRELISNASDSLEKYRYLKTTGGVKHTSPDPLEINIVIDKTKNTLEITDNGIGMTRDELISNLGTIARSGSKQFVEKIKANSTATSARDGDGIIGQFGVGFYSAFMVADSVVVDSMSAQAENLDDGNSWTSTGTGEFTMHQNTGISRGSRVVLNLKDKCKEFADVKKIKDIIKKYSNFVPFPIRVNGDIVNTVNAIWVQDKSSVTEEQYTEFYKFISNAFDKPQFTLHFRADAPINLNVLLFVPTFHTEKFGQGRMELGVNLYSRKVLIETKPKDLLPDWLR